MDNQVTYCFCDDYNYNKVKISIEKIITSCPELDNKLKDGNKLNILIKPNLLAPREPEKAVTTHPIVLKAIIHYIKQYGHNITIADSPAGTYNEKVLHKLYEACQIDKVAEETQSNLNFDLGDSFVDIPQGQVLKKSLIINPAVNADLIINVAKLKTHTFTRLTCATKNMFGLMPGVLKFRQHIAMPDIKVFAQMLKDINSLFEGKIFHIVDGIIGMEGAGPSGGTPKFAGALFGGTNPASVDILACHIMGMPVNSVPTLINYKGIEDININAFDEIQTYQFELPPIRNKSIPSSIPEWAQELLTELLVAKPVIDKTTCKKCNICIKSCPAEIINMTKSGATINSYKKCIRCYCCQESCPYKSIHLSTPIVERFYKLIRRLKK